MMSRSRAGLEPLTLAMIAFSYLGWSLSTVWLPLISPLLAIPFAALCIALHSSCQHEVLHGHPSSNRLFNEALVFPALGLFVPYRRFRDLHIAHHRDSLLTDPRNDPESNFLTPAEWAVLPAWRRRVLLVNNTLLGRILIGPALSTIGMIRDDWRLIRSGDRRVLSAWALHLAGLALVFWWLAAVANMPFWAYLLAAYFGYGLLKIRTYLEHRADPDAAGRTVIIEDRGPLALLFLYNNFHLVHHSHPNAPWYELPALYEADRESYLRRNRDYRFKSYAEVFRNYLLSAKDPVAHPLMPTGAEPRD